MFRKSLRPQPETAHRHEYWSRYAQSPLWPAARQKGATLYPPHLERSVRHWDCAGRCSCRRKLPPTSTINGAQHGDRIRGVGAQARSSSQTSKKQISRNEYRFRLQMRVAVAMVVVKGHQQLRGSSSNEMLELIPYSPQPQRNSQSKRQ